MLPLEITGSGLEYEEQQSDDGGVELLSFDYTNYILVFPSVLKPNSLESVSWHSVIVNDFFSGISYNLLYLLLQLIFLENIQPQDDISWSRGEICESCRCLGQIIAVFEGTNGSWTLYNCKNSVHKSSRIFVCMPTSLQNTYSQFVYITLLALWVSGTIGYWFYDFEAILHCILWLLVLHFQQYGSWQNVNSEALLIVSDTHSKVSFCMSQLVKWYCFKQII